MTANSLGAFVRQRRFQLGLTQEQLAERVGGAVRQTDISRIERDRVRLPHRRRVEALANALEVSFGEVLVRSGWMAERADEVAPGRPAVEPRHEPTARPPVPDASPAPAQLQTVDPAVARLRAEIVRSRQIQRRTTVLLTSLQATARKRLSDPEPPRNNAGA